jgi:hypothetical protein
MSADPLRQSLPDDSGLAFRRRILNGLMFAFAVIGVSGGWLLVRQLQMGSDFECFWAAARLAQNGLAHLYDFVYITRVQGWPLGPDTLRPYINPPSALLFFFPFGLLPYWVDYALWVAVTGGLFLFAGRRAGAPWWFVLLPWVTFAAYCGQVTFLVGGLALAGLAYGDRRILAGVLLGAAAAIKPQLVMLAPLALLAQGRWSTIVSAGVTGAILVGLSVAIWGVQPWLDWAAALGPFRLWAEHNLSGSVVNPYAVLNAHHLNGAWAYLLAPPVLAAVWWTFRRDSSTIDRSLAMFGGGLLLSPYALNYELALLTPAVAAHLARTRDRNWFGYVAGALAYVCTPPWVALYGAAVVVAARLWPGAGPRAVRSPSAGPPATSAPAAGGGSGVRTRTVRGNDR